MAPPPQTAGSRVIAAEVLVEFLHRYMYNANTLHPSLLTALLVIDRSPRTSLAGLARCDHDGRTRFPVATPVRPVWATGLKSRNVGACRGLEVSSASILFGQVPVRTTATRIVRIRNTALSRGVKYSGKPSALGGKPDGTLAPQEERVPAFPT